MDVPFTIIKTDSRHAATGTSTNFDITLPETRILPHNAACWVSDVVISNTMPTLGTGSGTLRHMFYFMDRYDGAIVLNRAHLDETKLYNIDNFIDTQCFWVQEKVKSRDFEIVKVASAKNPSDLFTKQLPEGKVIEHLGRMGCEFGN